MFLAFTKVKVENTVSLSPTPNVAFQSIQQYLPQKMRHAMRLLGKWSALKEFIEKADKWALLNGHDYL